MPLQILPQGPAGFGESFGSGLGSGLQALAQLKLNQISQRQAYDVNYQNALKTGVTPEVAHLMVNNPDLAKFIVPALGANAFANKQAAASAPAEKAGSISASPAAASIQPAQPPPPSQVENLLAGLKGKGVNSINDLLTSPTVSDATRNALSKLNLGEQFGKAEKAGASLFAQPEPLYPQAGSPAAQQTAQSQVGAQSSAPAGSAAPPPGAPKTIQEAFSNPDTFLSPHDKIERQRLEIEKQRAFQESYKINQDELDLLRIKNEQAQKDIKTYKEIKALVQKGEMYTGKNRQLLERLGLEDWFTNPDTQLGLKLTESLVTGAGTAFNTRNLTNLDVSSYAKTVGRSINTPEGLIAIADNRILQAEAESARYNATREISKEYIANKQPLPLDILDLGSERAQPELARLAQESLKNVEGALNKIEGKGNTSRVKEIPSWFTGTATTRAGKTVNIVAGKVQGG